MPPISKLRWPILWLAKLDTAHTVSAGSSHYDFVVSPDGSKVNFIETDKGFVVSGTMVRFKD
jgi:hypothetical protein